MYEKKFISDYKISLFGAKNYIKLIESSKIVEGRGYKFEFCDDIDLQIAVFRIDSVLYAVSNICPHRHAREIYKGIIDNCNVVCPLHGWTYSLIDGKNINSRQGTKNLTKYDIMEIDNWIYLEKPEIIIPKWRDAIEL